MRTEGVLRTYADLRYVSAYHEAVRECPFFQTLRYAQKITLEGKRACETPVSAICLR